MTVQEWQRKPLAKAKEIGMVGAYTSGIYGVVGTYMGTTVVSYLERD